MDASDVFERFLALERRLKWGACAIQGVRVWPLVRFHVYSKEVLSRLVPMGEPHPDISSRPDRSRGIVSRLASFVRRLTGGVSPLSRSRDILFAVNPRRVRLPDGREVAQMLDFFIDQLAASYAVLEYGRPGEPRHPRNWDRVFSLDGYRGRFELFRQKIHDDHGEMAAFAEGMGTAIFEEFGVRLDSVKTARYLRSYIALHGFYVPLFRRWLRRLQVKCVVTVVNYGSLNMFLCAAAHAEGVPVVELQHGTVYPAHAAYNLPCLDSEYSPDYLFAWGRHWAEQTRNYVLRKTVCTGYPMMEWMRRHHAVHASGAVRQVVFISQGTIGAELSKRAVALATVLPPEKFSICYKLHPNESKSWRTLYPWLAEGGVTVITGAEKSIYDLFQEAFATVGVYSTAVVEGLMWGVRAYIFTDVAGSDTMRPFLSEGHVEGVLSVAELAARLQSAEQRNCRTDGSRFWEDDAARKVVDALQEIVKNGELK